MASAAAGGAAGGGPAAAAAGGGGSMSSSDYDFDAPKYYDFQSSGYTEKEKEADRQAVALFLSKTREAMEQKHEDESADPWEFNAPTWADLTEEAAAAQPHHAPATSTGATTEANKALPPPPSRPAPASRIPRRASNETRASPAAPTSRMHGSSNNGPSPQRQAPASQAVQRPQQPPQEMVVEGAQVDPNRHSFVLQAAGAVPPPPPPAAAAPTKAPTAARPVRPTAGAAAKGPTPTKTNFVNRPRKEPAAVPSTQMQHSYLQHTIVAKKRAAPAPVAQGKDVHQLSSFLRPTQASWQRTQKEQESVNKLKEAKAAVAANKPPNPRTAYGRTAPKAAVPATKTTKAAFIKGESSEARDLRLAAEAQAKVKAQRQANQAFFEKSRAIGSTAANPSRSAKPLTIPVSPKLRGKPHPPELPEPQLHRPTANRAKPAGPPKLTVPHSPALTKPKPRAAGPDAPPPPPPARRQPPPPSTLHARPAPPPKLTQPHPPALKTDARAAMRPRAAAVLDPHTAEDEEEMRHQFKALPLDARILHSNGEFGVPKVTPSEVTQPKPFHFATEERAARRPPSSHDSADDQHHFHDNHEAHMHGPPSHSSHQHQSYHQPRLVEPQPFHLATERRGQMHKMAFEHKLAEEREAERAQREVHAHPVPRFDHTFHPHRSEKDLTEFAAFPLESVRRHEESRAVWEDSVRRLQQEEEEGRRIKARPLPLSTFHKTFEVKPSEREPLVAMSVNLNTTVRAEERKAFDEELQAKLLEAHAMQQAAAEETKRHEEEEMRRLRNLPVEQGGMQFVAKPVRHAPMPLVPAPSNRKLTVPVSPKLSTAVRSVVHRQQQHR